MKTTIAVLVLMASCIWVLPDAALGQPRTSDAPNAPEATSGTQSLPEWARPAETFSSTRKDYSGDVTMNQPGQTTLPPPGSRVPVDGGLGWLAVAGAAYAVSRLRKNDASDDEDAGSNKTI